MNDDTKTLAPVTLEVAPLSPFVSIPAFEAAQRVAKALMTSTMVPEHYQGNVGNCLIAMELAARTKSSILAIMQNVHVVYGKPGWSGAYCVAALNASGHYAEPIEYEFKGKQGSDQWGCRVIATTKSGKVIHGPWADIAMAKAEGWYDRKDKYGKFCSKWRTMPELMMRYRSASFFAKTETPELLMGMQTAEELQDIGEPVLASPAATIESLMAPTDDERADQSSINPESIIPVGPEDITPEWPKLDGGAWVDAFGMAYNPEIHAGYRGPHPTVNTDGSFRMRKGQAIAYNKAYEELATAKRQGESQAAAGNVGQESNAAGQSGQGPADTGTGVDDYDRQIVDGLDRELSLEEANQQDKRLEAFFGKVAGAQTQEMLDAITPAAAELVGEWADRAYKLWTRRQQELAQGR